MNNRASDDGSGQMIRRGLLVLLACVALIACNRGPPPVPYTESAFSTPMPATPSDAAEPAVPLPQSKPGTTVADAALPPLPAHKPGSQPCSVVVIVEPEPVPPVEVVAEPEPQVDFVDEELVLAPSSMPDGQDVKVEAGDTVYALSRRHSIAVRDIILANDLEPPYHLLIGQTVRLPASFTVAGVPLPQVKPAATALTAAPVNVADIPARTGGKFSWPVRGPVLSSFGPKDNGLHNDGINISAPAGTPVFAAEDGVVAYVGDELDGYGNLVLLRHGDGWVTAYAHNADVRVARGQRVIRGQVIASVGTTGGVGGPQTHFEIRNGSQAVDPLLYLEPL